MTNWKQIIKVLGLLFHIEGMMLLITMLVALIYEENVLPWIYPILLCALLGVGGLLIGRNADKSMGRRDGYIIVSVIWVLYSLVGMLPFLIDGCLPAVSDAFFETISGFTSTGATVIDYIDDLPKGILFWRSMIQWVGGIGIIFFTIAVLPAFGLGEVKIFAAESTGVFKSKVHPTISMTARWIGSIYIMLTLASIVALLLCGMNFFDALNLSMTATATGGYSTHSAFMHEVYDSAAIEYVLTVVMFLSGVNYTLLFYSLLKGKIHQLYKDPELRTYIIIAFSAIIVCAVVLAQTNDKGDWELAFRESAFTIVSMMTTTGFASCDYTEWPQLLMPIIMFVMYSGACSGSTSGGFKCVRHSILFRLCRNEFTRILHPRSVIPVKVGDNIVSTSQVKTLLGFLTLFICSLFIGAFVLAVCGVQTSGDMVEIENGVFPNNDHNEAFTLAMSSLSNVGPAMGYYGPAHSWSVLNPSAKWVCSFLMLIGRLEIYPILLLFTRGFWKER